MVKSRSCVSQDTGETRFEEFAAIMIVSATRYWLESLHDHIMRKLSFVGNLVSTITRAPMPLRFPAEARS